MMPDAGAERRSTGAAGDETSPPAPPPAPPDPASDPASDPAAVSPGPADGDAAGVFDLVLQALPDAVVVVDGRGRITHANEAAARLVDAGGSGLLGRSPRFLFGDRSPATPMQVFELAPQGHYVFETSVAASDGGPAVPVSVSCRLVRDPTEAVVGAVFAARDLRETRQLVTRLEQAEARWRLIAQLGDLLGRQLDPRDSLVETCRWLSHSTGAGVAVILAPKLTVERVVAWPPDSPLAERLDRLVDRPLEPGSALSTAVQGHQTVHAPTLSADLPLLDHAGAPEGMGSAAVVPLVARNLTLGALLVHSPAPGGIRQRALIEQAADRVALALANSELREAVSRFEADEEASQFREELLAAVSHDMQTPLAVLLGSIRALEAGDDLTPRERGHLYERMGRRGLQLRRLVQQFLDYSRLGAGRPVVVRPAMTDIRFALTQLEADIAGRRPVAFDMPNDLPPAYVDPDRLDQVMANLVSNALKFSPAGSPIAVRARATADTVELEVADQGQGMSAADLATVFRKFHRGAGAEDIPGTGLGLYVSRALIEAQHGRLVAASTLGVGSQFTVVLPRRPPPEGRADETRPPARDRRR